MNTTFPIILAHGICPFHRIPLFFHRDNQKKDHRHYFCSIKTSLLAHGFTVFHSRVSWGGELDRRARDLKNEINRLTLNFKKWPKVHIIAHSMGGLDSRWMIYRYKMEDRVDSLTTIGTPHLGTSAADVGIKKFGWLIPAVGLFGLNIKGFKDLTRNRCIARNRVMHDFEKNNGVKYQTVAGVQPVERIFCPFRRSFQIIWKHEGKNDGLVSLKSAMWKEEYFKKTIDADHLNQLGWWDRGESLAGLTRLTFKKRIQAVYLDIAKGLPL